MAGPDWKWWKAQLVQESRLDPEARSPVGASGLAQFMPGTWAQYAPALGYGTLPPTAACPAAEVGAYYMRQLQRQWSAPRPDMDRHRLAQGSYNAGVGNILKAQKACGGVSDWDSAAVCLPQITGKKNAAETTGYIRQIARWRALMGD